MMKGRAFAAACVLPFTLSAAPRAAETPPCTRVVAVGDLHGHYAGFLRVLRAAGLVDESLRWRDPSSCLVQTGDVLDRGPEGRRILDLLMRLQEETGDRVLPILGNHEVMNLTGDFRYVTREGFRAFAGDADGDGTILEEAFQAYRERLPGQLPPGAAAEASARRLPPGFGERRLAFSRDGRYGRWLASLPVVRVVGGTLFAHGGPDPRDLKGGVEALNARFQEELHRFLDLRPALEEAGVVSPFVGPGGAFAQARAWLEQADFGSQALDGVVREFLRLEHSLLFAPTSPIWNRTYAQASEAEASEAVDRILAYAGARRLVVGHTVTRDGRIQFRFQGRVALIDTGASPFYGGRLSALELERAEARSLYPRLDEPEPPVPDPGPMSDGAMEAFLLEARVVEREDIGEGVTKPQKLVLEKNGIRRKAAFKTVNIERRGVTKFPGKPPIFNFSDKYVYEPAAYILDRKLGLNMVPVAVIRTVAGRRGAVVAWVEDAVTEHERKLRGFEPPDSFAFELQRAHMRLFDALIQNDDRNLGNQLITLDDWKLHLIDHSRCFRSQLKLPAYFSSQPALLSRSVYERLEALEVKDLQKQLGPYLSRGQIRMLLKRRDKILEKIDADRKRLGDAIVFGESAGVPRNDPEGSRGPGGRPIYEAAAGTSAPM